MFGDDDELILDRFEELVEVHGLEDLLEQEDLTPAQALLKLYQDGHVRSPLERR